VAPPPRARSAQPFVVDHERALLESDRLGYRIVILDAVGHIEAIGLGHLLATMGRDVSVVTPLPTPVLLDAETAAAALPLAARAGMRGGQAPLSRASGTTRSPWSTCSPGGPRSCRRWTRS